MVAATETEFTEFKVDSRYLAKVVARAIKDTDRRDKVCRAMVFEIEKCGVVVGAKIRVQNPEMHSYTEYSIAASASSDGIEFKPLIAAISDPRRFLAWLKVIKQQPLRFEVHNTDSEHFLFVYPKRGPRAKFECMSPDMVPEWPEETEGTIAYDDVISASAGDMVTKGKVLLSAMSTDESRPYINGMGIHGGYIMSTDGHRMVVMGDRGGITRHVAESNNMIIPMFAFKRLVEEAAVDKRDVVMVRSYVATCDSGTSSYRWFRVDTANRVSYVRTSADTSPPDWKSVYPEMSGRTQVTIKKQEVEYLRDFLKQAVVLGTRGKRSNVPAKVSMRLEHERFVVAYDDMEIEIDVDIPVDETGQKFPVVLHSFNAKYLLDVFAALDGDVRIYMVREAKAIYPGMEVCAIDPILFVNSDADEDAIRIILMPMRA